MDKNKNIIKIDVDGVLRDMLSMMCELYNECYNENVKPEDVKDYDVDISFPKCKEVDGMSAKYFFFNEYSYDLCAYSNIINYAKEAMDILHNLGYYIIIVSYQNGYNNKHDTLVWLDEYNIYYDSICFTDRKDLIHGDIIVDDNPEFLDMCDDSEEKILIDTPYNKNENRYKRFISLYDYVLSIDNNN